MNRLFEDLYTIITFITLCVGLAVALLFLFGIIVGGSIGASLAVFAGEIISWAIILAALAVALGIIHLYINKQHTLTIDSQDES